MFYTFWKKFLDWKIHFNHISLLCSFKKLSENSLRYAQIFSVFILWIFWIIYLFWCVDICGFLYSIFIFFFFFLKSFGNGRFLEEYLFIFFRNSSGYWNPFVIFDVAIFFILLLSTKELQTKLEHVKEIERSWWNSLNQLWS